MAAPSFSDLIKYAGKKLTDTDWNFNFQKIINWMTGVNPVDVTFGTVTSGNITSSGTISAVSITGDGSSLTGITGNPIGSVQMYVGTSDPTNYLICDGRSLNRTTYASLYAIIGNAYGTADGSSFNIPDMRGMFARGLSMQDATFQSVNTTSDTVTTTTNHKLRTGMEVRFTNSGGALPTGLSTGTTYYVRATSATEFTIYDTRSHAITGGATGLTDLSSSGSGTNKVISWVDPDVASRLAITIGGNSGNSMGSWEQDAFQGHWHNVYGDGQLTGGGTAPNVAGSGTNYGDRAREAVTDGTHGTPRTSYETRPQNILFNYIIRYQ